MPANHDEAQDRATDRFWDHLAQNRSDAAGWVDPADAATIRHLHAHDDRPGPSRAFARHLKEDLMRAHALPVSSLPRPGGLPNGRALPFPRRAATVSPPPGRRWGIAPLATALLLLLTAGLSYVAFGPSRSESDPPIVIPAAGTAEGTPVPAGPAEQTLLEIALAAADLPLGDLVTGVLVDVEFAAGATATWSADLGACCPGLRFEYVRAGGITVRADGPARVFRGGGGGEPEPVPVGTEVVLGAGDALLSPTGTGVAYANPAPEPAALLAGVIHDSVLTFNDSPIPDGWTELHSMPDFDRPLPPGAATLRLQRIIVAGRGTVSPPPGARQYGVLTEEQVPGTPVPRDVGIDDDGSLYNFGRGSVVLYVLTLEATAPADDPTGSPTPT